MIRVGLTGPIASGKSVLSEAFKKVGFNVLDADQVVHDLYIHNGEVSNAVLAAFPGAADRRGGIDRRRLGEIVFGGGHRLDTLERIVHPHVVDAIADWFESRRNDPVAVVEAALWHRVPSKDLLDVLITVQASRQARKTRLLERGLSEEEAESRLEAQGTVLSVETESQWVIQNNETIADLKIEAIKLIDRLRGLATA